jgi:hypothetical protein
MKDEKPKQEKETQEKKASNRGGAREGAGRPRFVPMDDERVQVATLAGYGIPLHQIAALVRGGIAHTTLTEYFSEEMLRGRAEANAGVGKTLWTRAMAGDTAAMIWWSKTQLRWSEVQKHEHTSPDGSMTPVIQRALTREELAEELKSRGLPTTVIGDD